KAIERERDGEQPGEKSDADADGVDNRKVAESKVDVPIREAEPHHPAESEGDIHQARLGHPARRTPKRKLTVDLQGERDRDEKNEERGADKPKQKAGVKPTVDHPMERERTIEHRAEQTAQMMRPVGEGRADGKENPSLQLPAAAVGINIHYAEKRERVGEVHQNVGPCFQRIPDDDRRKAEQKAVKKRCALAVLAKKPGRLSRREIAADDKQQADDN